MKRRIIALVISLLLLVACAPRHDSLRVTADDVLFTLVYLSGGPAPIARQVTFMQDGSIYYIQSGRPSKHYILSSARIARINSIIESHDFRSALERQKVTGPAFACCDAEELGISFERPPNKHSIRNAVSFHLDALLPRSVSDLLVVVNDSLLHEYGEPFLEQWKTGDA